MHHTQAPIKVKGISIALATIVCCSMFALLHTLIRFEKDEYFRKEQQAAINYAQLLSSSVDKELNSLLFISNGLASYLTVYKNDLNSEKINAILQDLWTRAKNVRNLGIAVGYRITYVYPFKSNEKIIGVDFRNIPLQWKKVKMAIDSRQGILDGPIKLLQGGSGIVYRYPIYIEDHYWGILSTVINTQPFLKSAFQHIQNDDYEFAIRTENKKVFFGNPELFNHRRAVLIESNVPNGKWEWAIEKHGLEQPRYFYLMDGLTILFSLLAAVGVYYYVQERYSLKREAMIDSLTNLPNRRYLDKKLLQASIEVEQNHELLCVMLIDVDYFKGINDTYGHVFGDAALVRVAKIIQSKIRGTDTLSRMGGDEFVLLLDHLKSQHDAELIALKIMEAFDHPQEVFGSIIKLSLSIGLATSNIGEKVNIKRILKHADEALYLAKGEGRGRYKIYKDS